MRTIPRSHARIVVEPLDRPISVSAAVERFCRLPEPAILESSRWGEPHGRFTILAADPARVCELHGRSGSWAGREFRAAMDQIPPSGGADAGLHAGVGWIGYFAYESGLAIEPILAPSTGRARTVETPLARFGLYDAAAVYDHAIGRWFLSAIEWPCSTRYHRERPSAQTRLEALRQRLLAASDDADMLSHPALRSAELIAATPYASYLDRVARAKRYLEAGDIYQVNLTQRFTFRTDEDPAAIYLRLRRLSPSSHAAFLAWSAPRPIAVLCSSPELFLELRDGHVVTRPIKGTRPRTGDPAADAANRRELRDSEKDRAELNMIVDLLRNDLGRVCRYGSVRVVDAEAIEEHPTVYHRVATIEGRLSPGRDWLDLLEAAFPGGSITGAPKIRAMQIIHELETTPRGAYCGAIGHIGLEGSAARSLTLNVAIRTMVHSGPFVHVHAGGAIVADSRAENEYDEILAKSAAMVRAVGGALNPNPRRAARGWDAARRRSSRRQRNLSQRL